MRFALIVSYSTLLAGCSGSGGSSTENGAPDGAALFSATCAKCHGETLHADTAAGRQVGAKDLATVAARALDDAQIARQIESGKGNMPAFGSQFSSLEVRALVAEVRRRQASQ